MWPATSAERRVRRRDFHRENRQALRPWPRPGPPELAEPPRPLKATQRFAHVPSRVRAELSRRAQAEPSPAAFMASHAKTGPFLPPDSAPEHYRKVRPAPALPADPDLWSEADLEPVLCRIRFGEIAIEARRERIRHIIRDIAQTRPLVESRRPGSRSAGRFSSLERARSSAQPRLSTVADSRPLGRAPSLSRLSTADSRPLGRAPSLSRLSTVAGSVVSIPITAATRSQSAHLGRLPHPPEDVPRPPEPVVGVDRLASRLDLASECADSMASYADELGDELNGLPVVRGVGMDYIHANIDGASVLGHRRRALSSAASVGSQSSVARHPVGAVPGYLRARQKEWQAEADRRLRAQALADVPQGHRVLGDLERVATLKRLNDRYEGVIVEMNRLPVSSDTRRIRVMRATLVEELDALDAAIKTYSRPRVFILDA